MAKKYTEAQWEKRMSRLPVEDRVAYANSPDADMPTPTSTSTMGAVGRGEYTVSAPKTTVAQAPGTSPQTVVTPNVRENRIPATPVAATTVVTTATTSEPAPEDAIFRIAVAKLSQYGLSGIADALRKARNDYPELDVDDLLFLVENDDKYNKPFKDRFKANAARELKGLPKLSAANYLQMEQDYKKLFSTYNLPMFSNQGQFDKLIAGDVDIDDATDRVVKAYDRVLTDTSTRNAFRQFYGTLTDSDIVSALLDPEQQMPALEKKVVAAEIGGQALRQGLATGLKPVEAMVTPEGKQVSGYTNVQRGSLGAEALAGEGVTEATAAAEYERIAGVLPTAEKLSSIYAGRAEQYGQKQAEEEQLLGLASARRKREKLTAIEQATFSGESGTMRTSLGRRGRGGAF